MTETTLRAALAIASAHLEAAGLNRGTSGNVSARFGSDILITPTGASAATLAPDDLVMIDLDGVALGPGIPSSEWQMHTAIYRAFPAALAVVHTHADACVALSCLREPIPPFHYMVASFGGDDVRCSAYAPFGSTALGEAAVAALGDRTACLLANHGMVAYGPDVASATVLAIKLETLARQYLLARQAGAPVLLSPSEMAATRRRYVFYGKAAMPRDAEIDAA